MPIEWQSMKSGRRDEDCSPGTSSIGGRTSQTLVPTTRPTSRRPIPERYTKNAAFYPERVCTPWTKLLIPTAGDAHDRRCGVADNKSHFLLTRTLCVPLARWRLAPAAKFDLRWRAKANLEEDGNAHLPHRNNRT